MGKCDRKTSFEILDYFYDNGGNFIDTANNYQGEESETWLGEWMKARDNRDQMVIATKFSSVFPAPSKLIPIKSNYSGNHAKSLHVSLEASLKKLQTSYIDLLYVHWWDFSTSIPELMQSLHHMVVARKVLYLGISDTPAWIVSKANEYARCHGYTQFSVYQGKWSAADRDFERDILPMCEQEGMALCPWGALGRGNFKSAAEFEEGGNSEGRKMGPPSEDAKKVSRVLEKLAGKKNTLITSVAQAYVMHKAPYVFPIIGGRKLEHLKANIAALAVELSDEEIDEIESAAPFDVGFPMSMLFEYGGKQKYSSRMTSKDIPLLQASATLDIPEKLRGPKPHKD